MEFKEPIIPYRPRKRYANAIREALDKHQKQFRLQSRSETIESIFVEYFKLKPCTPSAPNKSN